MTPERRRVAVLGGTFDPVHRGHLEMATAAREAIDAEEAWLMPANLPAMREPPIAPAQLRLAMLRAAARAVDRVTVADLELRRGGVSYTIDTLEALRDGDPGTESWWVVGADAARQLAGWHRSQELLDIIHLVVLQRAGAAHFGEAEAGELGLDPARTVVLDVTPPPISASEVRRRVGAGESIATLVLPAVADIIAASGLYRSAPVR